MQTFGFIPSPSTDGFSVGPFFIHLYGIIYAAMILVGILITARRWEEQGGSRDLALTMAIWSIPAGIIGARLYFLATSWNEVPSQWWGPFAIWKGGLGVWGAVSMGALAAIIVLRREGADVARFADAAAPALLVAHGIGRFGNYVNQELFGRPTTLPWGLEIDVAHRPLNYKQFATFHPTFLYEMILDFSLAALLVWLGHHRNIKPPGLFALYVAGYSFFRIFEELLRVDPSHYIFGLRLNFYLACTLFIVGSVWFVLTQRRGSESKSK